MSADEAKSESSGTKGRLAGWVKGLLGTAAGLASGIAMMYVTGFVNNYFKPPKPLANFAVDLQGQTVMFHNRSTNDSEGWWDFGDGSPLEPVTIQQESVTHAYAKPGTYTVKLSLRNLLGEESERSVTVNVDSASAALPEIVGVEAIPLSPGGFAPATYRFIGRTKNASCLIWDYGDDERTIHVLQDPANDNDDVFTFTRPGGYHVKMLAVNGKEAPQKSFMVNVLEAPPNSVTAVLSMKQDMTQVFKRDRVVTLTENFTAKAGNTQKLEKRMTAWQGFTFVDAKLVEPVDSVGAKDLAVQVSADHRTALLTGQLIREGTAAPQKGQPLPHLTARVRLQEEKQVKISKDEMPIAGALNVPGAIVIALPPTPCDCKDIQRQMRIELKDGTHTIWQGTQLPHGVPVLVHNKQCTLSAMQAGDQIRVELQEAKGTAGRSPLAN